MGSGGIGGAGHPQLEARSRHRSDSRWDQAALPAPPAQPAHTRPCAARCALSIGARGARTQPAVLDEKRPSCCPGGDHCRAPLCAPCWVSTVRAPSRTAGTADHDRHTVLRAGPGVDPVQVLIGPVSIPFSTSSRPSGGHWRSITACPGL